MARGGVSFKVGCPCLRQRHADYWGGVEGILATSLGEGAAFDSRTCGGFW